MCCSCSSLCHTMSPLFLVVAVGGLLCLNIPGAEAQSVLCYSDFDEVTGGCTEYLGDDVSENDCCLNIKYSFRRGPGSICEACRPAEWSSWSEWSPCSVSCLEGVQSRQRTCTGQGDCEGDGLELQACTPQDCCPQLGGWSAWSSWSSCSVTCERGRRLRSRECNNPPPGCGGTCIGGAQQTEECDTQIVCPTHGSWGSWGPWGQCSSHCANEGARNLPVQTRQRDCNNPPPSRFPPGDPCPGDPLDTRDCTGLPLCPVDGNWGAWTRVSDCSVTCGVGIVRESRECNNPAPRHGGSPCGGSPNRQMTCNTKTPCPIDGQWSEWQDWSPCSLLQSSNIKCKERVGTQQRKRVCDGTRHEGKWCQGPYRETRHCYNRENCAAYQSVWSEWSPWGLCFPHCGASERTRERVCNPVHPPYKETTELQNEKIVPVFFSGDPKTNCDPINGNTLKVEEKIKCQNVPQC
ncbi:properdin-like [Discoglossus pictus]